MAIKKAASPAEEYAHETHMPVIHQFDETGKLLGVTKAESHETKDSNPEPWGVHKVGQAIKDLEGMGLKAQLGFLRRPQPLMPKEDVMEGSTTKRVPAKNPKPKSATKKPAAPKAAKPAAKKAAPKKAK